MNAEDVARLILAEFSEFGKTPGESLMARAVRSKLKAQPHRVTANQLAAAESFAFYRGWIERGPRPSQWKLTEAGAEMVSQ